MYEGAFRETSSEEVYQLRGHIWVTVNVPITNFYPSAIERQMSQKGEPRDKSVIHFASTTSPIMQTFLCLVNTLICRCSRAPVVLPCYPDLKCCRSHGPHHCIHVNVLSLRYFVNG